MLNSIIKVDLHIHSAASNYKEARGFVEKNTVDNIDVLFKKLDENNVGLFSITDHNRFDSKLYEKAFEIISQNKYTNVKGLLAGVEFDVKLESEMGVCHIITIFDAKNKQDWEKIESAIREDLLSDESSFYSVEKYEAILRNIGLNTILIVHQKNSFDNETKTKTKSLSDSCSNPKALLKIGYINALEFKTSRTEGILKNNLKGFEKNVPLITGSDCHQWDFYPYRSGKDDNGKPIHFTEMKCLPNFKGLLLSITSPDTRINLIRNRKNNCFKSFSIGNDQIWLDDGINAIIGENGSGKSSLLSLLGGKKNENYLKLISKENNFSATEDVKCFVVEQSQIAESSKNNKLFSESLFTEPSHSDFEAKYKSFNDGIYKFITSNIEKLILKNKMSGVNFTVNMDCEIATHFITITNIELENQKVCNDDAFIRKEKLFSIIKNFNDELISTFYDEKEKELLNQIKGNLIKIYSSVLKKYYDIENKETIKNKLFGLCKDYETDLNTRINSRDKKAGKYKADKEKMCQLIIKYIKMICSDNKLPSNVDPIAASITNTNRGYNFVNEARYHNENVSLEYLKTMFVKKIESFEILGNIKSYEDFKDAIFGCSEVSFIKDVWHKNFDAFLRNMKACKKSVFEATQNVNKGRTPGQISLTYYKYHFSDIEQDVILIDQPEDNISNNLINTKLINYLNELRNSKQVILVTHNPLLIINLDVDNVIKVNMTEGLLNCECGCLEDDSSGILKYVAENMDGGKESILKRFKLYE